MKIRRKQLEFPFKLFHFMRYLSQPQSSELQPHLLALLYFRHSTTPLVYTEFHNIKLLFKYGVFDFEGVSLVTSHTKDTMKMTYSAKLVHHLDNRLDSNIPHIKSFQQYLLKVLFTMLGLSPSIQFNYSF